MKKTATLALAALLAASPAMADNSREALCKSTTSMLREDRQKKDLKEGASYAFVASRAEYNATSGKCYGILIEFFTQDGTVWTRRSIIDPINRTLYALFKEDKDAKSILCQVKIDGVLANCADSDDFERIAKKNFGIDISLKGEMHIR